MNSLVFFLIFLQICSVYSEVVCEESCEKFCNISNKADSSEKFSVLNSVIYELTNILPAIDIQSDLCHEELLLIKDGIREKEVWALKRKYSNLLKSNTQITKYVIGKEIVGLG